MSAYEKLKRGRTSGWTSAVGIVLIVSATTKDSGQVFICCVALSGEYGHEGIGVTMPVKRWREAVQQIVDLE